MPAFYLVEEETDEVLDAWLYEGMRALEVITLEHRLRQQTNADDPSSGVVLRDTRSSEPTASQWAAIRHKIGRHLAGMMWFTLGWGQVAMVIWQAWKMI